MPCCCPWKHLSAHWSRAVDTSHGWALLTDSVFNADLIVLSTIHSAIYSIPGTVDLILWGTPCLAVSLPQLWTLNEGDFIITLTL
jgi:hypothetical protein